MKKKSHLRHVVDKKMISVTLGLCMSSMVLFNSGCEKADKPKPASASNSVHAMNSQEQLLVGSWDLRQKETYEVLGIDSLGNCSCSLISTMPGDPACEISFFNSVMGAGSIGGCDHNAGFSWNVPQPNKLQTNNGVYAIEYLCKDSMALSTVYVKDILDLKDVYYYTRKQ